MIKFTVKDFNEKYANDDVCLDEIFKARYGEDKIVCPNCNKESNFYRITTKKVYGCQFCGHQVSPTAGTIFHKSPTSLKNWFFAIYLFSVSKNGVSAKELERQLGVTYKCAWRMAKQIRLLFSQSQDILSGVVEADETYIGGKGTGKRGRGAENKTPVIGVVERKGAVKAQVITDTKKSTVSPIIRSNVDIKAQIMTDEYLSYNGLTKAGYNHQTIKHGAKEFVRGDVHTNTIEGFWSQLKRSIRGTYHFVSPKYLQEYVNEFAYRYNVRLEDAHPFQLMFARVVMPVR